MGYSLGWFASSARGVRNVRTDGMKVLIRDGDLLDQPVEVVVNAWNRNIIPWWLLWPQGVWGSIKRRGGIAPFREVARHEPIRLGGAVATGAGRLPFLGIIHVAGIDMWWRASEYSVRESVRSAMGLVCRMGCASVAFPLIGAGSGGGSAQEVERFMLDELSRIEYEGAVYVVRFRRGVSIDRKGGGSWEKSETAP